MSLSPHAQRLDSALRTHVGNDFADALLRGHPLSVSATPERKFRWAICVCGALSSLPPETAHAIRRDCRCNDGRTMANQIAACIRKAGGLAGGCRLFTQTNPFKCGCSSCEAVFPLLFPLTNARFSTIL